MKTIIYDQPEKVGEWVCSKAGGIYSKQHCQSIGIEENGELVAGFLYDQYREKSIGLHVAIKDGYFFKKEDLRICFSYPFYQLNVNKIIGMIDSSNKKCINFCKRVGANIEVIIKDASKNGDLVVVSLKKENCKFIGKK